MRIKIKTTVLLLGDLGLLYASLAASLFLRYPAKFGADIFKNHAWPFAVIFLVWLLFFGAFGLYDFRSMKNSKGFLYRLMQAMFYNALASSLIFYFFPLVSYKLTNGIEPKTNLIIILIFSTILIFVWRYFFNYAIAKTPQSRVLFWGVNKEIMALSEYLTKNPQLGQKPLGFITDGEYANIQQKIDKTKANTIVITKEIKGNKTLVKTLFQLIPKGISIIEFDSYCERLTGKVPLSLIEELWFLENLVGIKKQFYEFFKRVLDLLLSIILILPALVILPLIALAIKLDTNGPIFFKQKRVGRSGKIFELIKYRSMVKDAEFVGGLKGEGYDIRLTRAGYYLRKSYLDELPQIINVLNGDMSFVGPRPERPEYIDGLKKEIPFYEMRLLVSPGLTGWAQIHMENDASVEDAPEKMQYDLYYVKNRSFTLDLLISMRTIFTLLRRRGR